MLQRNQEFIDQFNYAEQRWHRLQWRKAKRRVRFPKLGALSHAILDLRDEMREKRRPVDCVSSKRIFSRRRLENQSQEMKLGSPIENNGARQENGGQGCKYFLLAFFGIKSLPLPQSPPRQRCLSCISRIDIPPEN